MPKKIRPGLEYFGLDLPQADLDVLRKISADEDRSVASLIRRIVANWIEQDAKATLLKSTGTHRPGEAA